MSEEFIDVSWRGTFDTSGYGIWGRKLCDVLMGSGKYRVKPIPTTGRLKNDDPFYYLQDFELKNEIHVDNLIPLYPVLGKKAGYCTCTELRRPPEEQIVNLEKAKFVLSLSKFSTDAYKNVVSEPEKVFQVNFPMFRGEFLPKGKALTFPNLDKYKFKFLTVGRIDVRKNLETLIKAFTDEFGNNPEVCLILKIYSPDTCVPLWIKKHNPSKNIYWLDFKFPAMDVLYRAVNAYITTDLGEAWSGPTMEAMLCGLPTIAPRHSGHLDYMNDDNSYPIEVSNWREIGHRENNIYRRLLPSYGQVKYPLMESIKEQMKKVFKEYRGLTREEVLQQSKIIKALQVQKIADRNVVFEQLDKCFKWVNKQYG